MNEHPLETAFASYFPKETCCQAFPEDNIFVVVSKRFENLSLDDRVDVIQDVCGPMVYSWALKLWSMSDIKKFPPPLIFPRTECGT